MLTEPLPRETALSDTKVLRVSMGSQRPGDSSRFAVPVVRPGAHAGALWALLHRRLQPAAKVRRHFYIRSRQKGRQFRSKLRGRFDQAVGFIRIRVEIKEERALPQGPKRGVVGRVPPVVLPMQVAEGH